MDRAAEWVLAWSLVDLTKATLTPERQTRLFVTVGAGDQGEAVHELLDELANQGMQIPTELWAPVSDWVAGYRGTDGEPRLRALLARLGVPHWLSGPLTLPGLEQITFEQRPRRVRHGRLQTAWPAGTVLTGTASLARRPSGYGLSSPAAAITRSVP